MGDKGPKKHLLLKQSSNWLSAVVKRTDVQTIDVTAGNQAWNAPTSVLAVTVMTPVKMDVRIVKHWKLSTTTLTMSRKIRKTKFVEKYNFVTGPRCIKSLLPVTWPCRSVAINYLLSKTSQNIETDFSLSQKSNKRPFFSRFIVQPRSHTGQNSALLLTPSKNPLHTIQKCRQH